MRRSVAAYSKETERLVERFPIRGLDLKDLQSLFGVPSDDEMYACFEVSESHRTVIESAIDHILDFDRFDYFVEARSG